MPSDADTIAALNAHIKLLERKLKAVPSIRLINGDRNMYECPFNIEIAQWNPLIPEVTLVIRKRDEQTS